jgi:hypothetical protein
LWHLLNRQEGSEKRDLKGYWGITFPITYSGCVYGNFFYFPALAFMSTPVAWHLALAEKLWPAMVGTSYFASGETYVLC